jgi:hypothetical protein
MTQREQTTWRGIRIAAIAIAVILIGGMIYVALSATRVRPVPTPTKTPTAIGQKTALPADEVTVVHIATSTPSVGNVVSAYTPTPTGAAGEQPAATPTSTSPVKDSPSPLPPQPTETPVAVPTRTSGADATPTIVSQSNQSPLPLPTAAASPTATTPAAAIPATTMYVCGYDRCRDSSEYGTLSFETGISVWENPEPDRGDIARELVHGDVVQVVAKKHIYDGPGGLWYQLEDGGWISGLWLTEQLCTSDNLPEFSFDRCSSESN